MLTGVISPAGESLGVGSSVAAEPGQANTQLKAAQPAVELASNPEPNKDSIPEKLKQLQTMKNDGVITDAEYQMKKKELLKKM